MGETAVLMYNPDMTERQSSIVTGKLLRANKDNLGLKIKVEGIVIPSINPIATNFVFELNNSEFSIMFESVFDNLIPDDLIRLVKETLESVQLTLSIIYGTGITLEIEQVNKNDGTIIKPQNDYTNGFNFDIDMDKVFQLIGSCFPLRSAIRDFNYGMIDRENCPLLFYRAIEIIGRMYLDKLQTKDSISNNEWQKVHDRLGTSLEEIKPLWEINKRHRHGDRWNFTREEHLNFMNQTRNFLYLSIKDLVINPISLSNNKLTTQQ